MPDKNYIPSDVIKRRTRFAKIPVGHGFYYRFTQRYYKKISAEHAVIFGNNTPVYVFSDFVKVHKTKGVNHV